MSKKQVAEKALKAMKKSMVKHWNRYNIVSGVPGIVTETESGLIEFKAIGPNGLLEAAGVILDIESRQLTINRYIWNDTPDYNGYINAFLKRYLQPRALLSNHEFENALFYNGSVYGLKVVFSYDLPAA